MNYENIKSTIRDRVGIVTLDRPDALNALSDDLMRELTHALTEFETNDKIGAIIITGSSKAFAAGADIKGMIDRTYMDAYLGDFIGRHWHGVADCRKPIIAAVAGYALGGGMQWASQGLDGAGARWAPSIHPRGICPGERRAICFLPVLG